MKTKHERIIDKTYESSVELLKGALFSLFLVEHREYFTFWLSKKEYKTKKLRCVCVCLFNEISYEHQLWTLLILFLLKTNTDTSSIVIIQFGIFTICGFYGYTLKQWFSVSVNAFFYLS